jgi:hypothetical protein
MGIAGWPVAEVFMSLAPYASTIVWGPGSGHALPVHKVSRVGTDGAGHARLVSGGVQVVGDVVVGVVCSFGPGPYWAACT